MQWCELRNVGTRILRRMLLQETAERMLLQKRRMTRTVLIHLLEELPQLLHLRRRRREGHHLHGEPRHAVRVLVGLERLVDLLVVQQLVGGVLAGVNLFSVQRERERERQVRCGESEILAVERHTEGSGRHVRACVLHSWCEADACAALLLVPATRA